MRAASSALLLAVAVACAAGAPARAADETTNFRADARRSGGVPDSPVTPPLRMRWRADLGRLASNVIVAGNRVFYVRQPGTGLKLTALDVASGAQLWSQDALPDTGLAYDQDRLYVVSDGPDPHGSTGVRARALDPASGNQVWSADFAEEYGVGGYPVAAGGQLFFTGSSGGSGLYGLNGANGAQLWSRRSLVSGDSSPAVDGDTVYVSLPAHHTYAFDRATGATRWHSSGCCSGGGGANPIVDSGRVYGYDGLVHNTSDGAIVDKVTYFPSFLGQGTGVQLVADGLRGFGPGLGATRWQVRYDTYDVQTPLLAGQHVYVGGTLYTGAMLRVLRNADGGEAWCQKLALPPGSESSSSSDYTTPPVAAGNGVVVVSVGYGLAAFESGGTPSTCDQPDRTAAPPAPGPAATAPANLVNAAAGPALTIDVKPRKVTLGQRVAVGGAVLGVERPAGLTVAVDVDAWPFEGRWEPAIRTRVLRDGTYGVSFVPKRNLRVRARLVRDPRATTAARDVFADHRARVTVTGRGGPRPRLRVTIAAPRGTAVRKRRVFAYLARGRGAWTRVAGRRWSGVTKRTVTVRFAFPRGSLGRRDHWLVCTPEPVPDAFGEPTEIERRCGARTLPRALS